MEANRSDLRVASARESLANAPRPPFRWKSRLGVAVMLFLIIGGLNFVLAIAVPITLHLGGAAAFGGQLVLGDAADHCAFLGRCLSDIDSSDPVMAAFLVAFMDTMCAFMMSCAVLQIGLAWYALRRAQQWALWSSLISNLAIVPYYLAIGWMYAQRGIRLDLVVRDLLVTIGPTTTLAIVATVVGRSGIQQAKGLSATAS
jgi:hypothetical protein